MLNKKRNRESLKDSKIPINENYYYNMNMNINNEQM